MELKLDVYLSLRSTIKDDLAQMMVEVYYVVKQNKGGGGGSGDSDDVECCGTIPDFIEAVGITQNMDGKTSFDFYKLYFGDELMELILAESK